MLRRPGEVVAEKQADVPAIALHLESAHIGVIDGKIGALLDGDAEQLGRHVESGGNDVVELQVGLDLAVVDVELGLARLFRVVAPVPSGQLEIAALGAHRLLQLVALLGGAGERRAPHLHQQLAHRPRRLGHGELQRGVGRRLEAQQLRPLGPELQDLGDDLAVVGLAAIGAAHGPGLEGLLAQVAPGRILQERLDAGARQGNGMLARVAAILGGLGRRRAHGFGQAGEVGLVLQHEHEGLLVGEQVLTEASAEHGHALGDRRHALLGLGREPGPGLDEGAVVALEHAGLLLAEL